MEHPSGTHGIMAEFRSATELVVATRQAHADGYRKMEAYSPFPIEALDEALGIKKTILPWLVFLGGIFGGMGGYGLEYWTANIAYPIIIGGKGFHSWPAFIPVWFETTVLGASITAVVGMILLNGFPTPYHPVFNVPRFVEAAQKDGFFLVIESEDPKFNAEQCKKFLSGLNASGVWEVEN